MKNDQAQDVVKEKSGNMMTTENDAFKEKS